MYNDKFNPTHVSRKVFVPKTYFLFFGKLIELEELDIQIQAINLFTICQVS